MHDTETHHVSPPSVDAASFSLVRQRSHSVREWSLNAMMSGPSAHRPSRVTSCSAAVLASGLGSDSGNAVVHDTPLSRDVL